MTAGEDYSFVFTLGMRCVVVWVRELQQGCDNVGSALRQTRLVVTMAMAGAS